MDFRSLIEIKKNPSIADFRPGDSVRVYARVIEGDRQRVQAFEGVVIRVRRRGIGSTFTVRRVSHGVGVERTFAYHSPLIEKVDVVRVGRVRRAKLYYLRQRVGKKARIRAGSRERFEELTAARAVTAAAGEAEEEEAPEEELAAEEAAEEEAEEVVAEAAEEETGEEAASEAEEIAAEAAEEEPGEEETPEEEEEGAGEEPDLELEGQAKKA